MWFLPKVLANAKGVGGATGGEGKGTGRVRRPTRQSHSSNARAPSVNLAAPRRRPGALNSGRLQAREEHSLLKAASSDPESSPLRWAGALASPPAYTGRADSSASESSDHKVIGSHSELFAASVGNEDWLRFCLKREHKERIVDDKVKLAA